MFLGFYLANIEHQLKFVLMTAITHFLSFQYKET